MDGQVEVEVGRHVEACPASWAPRSAVTKATQRGGPGRAVAVGVRPDGPVEDAHAGDTAWDHLLRWHDQTLRSLFAEYGGIEVNRIGDGFFVAFDRPDAAIHCAVEIQRALARHRIDHGFAPGVRIGVHEAEATREGSDYQGRGVHEAARIAGAADGDEILISSPVAAHVDSWPLSGPRAVKLKGLRQPIDVYTVAWH